MKLPKIIQDKVNLLIKGASVDQLKEVEKQIGKACYIEHEKEKMIKSNRRK